MTKTVIVIVFVLAVGKAFGGDPRCDGIDYSALKGTLIQRTEGEGRHVYVTRRWYGLTLDNKQALARYLANCKSAGRWVRIYDAHTGKELGKFSSMGYSNYER